MVVTAQMKRQGGRDTPEQCSENFGCASAYTRITTVSVILTPAPAKDDVVVGLDDIIKLHLRG